MQNSIYHSPLTLPALEAARNAGGILRKGFGTQFITSSKESVHDLVTEFDRSTEEAIIQHLKTYFPLHTFLGEESGLSENIYGDVQWIIDPLDGTMNFAHHIPLFCVSIAAMVNGQIEVGVIYDPMLDEMFVAERGFGAFLNEKPIHVSSVEDIKIAVSATGFPYGDIALREQSMRQFHNCLDNLNPIRLLGSAALTLAYVAAGRFDHYWGSNLKPWDVAAGKLLIEEAGGKVTHFDGSSVDIFQISNTVATNTLLHEQVLTLLNN